MGGATILENVKVSGIRVQQGAGSRIKSIAGVNTDHGKIDCEYLVNCAGMWAREIGKMVDVSLPLFAAEHMAVR